VYFWPFEIATMRTKPLLIFILLLTSVNVLCQDSICSTTVPVYLSFYTKFSFSNSEIDIPVPNTDNELIFESNSKSSCYLGFHYSWLGIDYAFSLPSDDVNLYGKTESGALNVQVKLKRWTIELKNRNYNGYYFSNQAEFDEHWKEGNACLQLSDLSTSSTSLSVEYVFNPGKLYSNKIYTYEKVPDKSGGSWLANGFASVNGVYSDSLIVPPAIRSYADPGINYKSTFYADSGVSLGYSYLWVLSKELFTSVTVVPGVSFQRVVEDFGSDELIKTNNRISSQILFNFNFGYNTEKFYCGLTSNFECKNYGSEMAVNYEKGGIVFLYRIDTSNWKFMKGVDKLMHPRFLRFAVGDRSQR